MSQSLKALMGSLNKTSWAIGQSRSDLALPINQYNNSGATVFDYEGMKILYRGAEFTLLQSDYPEAYAAMGIYFGNPTYTVRSPTGQTICRWLDSNGSILIVVGDGGKISRSTDGGVTWAAVTSPTALNIKRIRYIPSISRWVAPLTTNKCLISTDATGASFTETTVTGLSVDLSSIVDEIRFEYIGTAMVLCVSNKTFTSTNGTAWTEVLVNASYTYRKLTIGNGYFVIVSYNNEQVYYSYSSNGSSWSSWLSLNNNGGGGAHAAGGYGMVYDGSRWIWICGQADSSEYLSTYPTSGSPPPANYYYESAKSAYVFAYTANGNPGSSVNYISYSWGGNYYTSWQNWKGSVGTTQYWYAPGWSKNYYSGKTARSMPNASSIIFNNTNDYFFFHDSNQYISGSNANGFFSEKINGGSWNIAADMGTINVPPWSTLVASYLYAGTVTTSSVTADSYYFANLGISNTVVLSVSVTNPSLIIPGATPSGHNNQGFNAFNCFYLRIK